MCECNKKKYSYVKNLALKFKQSEPTKIFVIYTIVGGYNFCELSFAQTNKFNIIEIV